MMSIKFSPILDRYIRRYDYKTRNYIQGFKMKFTKFDKNQEALEAKFE